MRRPSQFQWETPRVPTGLDGLYGVTPARNGNSLIGGISSILAEGSSHKGNMVSGCCTFRKKMSIFLRDENNTGRPEGAG